MAFTQLDILGVEHGKPRVRLVCRAIQPITAYLNLSKLDAGEVSLFTDLIGKRAMIPCRMGMTDNGMVFYVHTPQDGDPIELPSPVSKPVEASKAPAGIPSMK